MTITIKGRNPNDVFVKTVQLVRKYGVILPSRNGPMKEVPEPVSVTFSHPKERVLFHHVRRINPFLHFFEPFWILAGRDDVAFLSQIVDRFKEFSDDGKTLFGAYGYRLKKPVNQIRKAIERLEKDPDDRRVVLQIRRQEDINYVGKDTPCNTSIAVKIRGGKLKMHVFNRSNDVIWGGPAGGSNYPQFTILQEYIAGQIGCDVGDYTVTTDSLHAYIERPDWALLEEAPSEVDYYSTGQVEPFPMMANPEKFDLDLHNIFVNDLIGMAQSEFFKEVYMNMWVAMKEYKAKRYKDALFFAQQVGAEDWREATANWLLKFTGE